MYIEWALGWNVSFMFNQRHWRVHLQRFWSKILIVVQLFEITSKYIFDEEIQACLILQWLPYSICMHIMIQKITAFILLLLSSVTPVVAGDLTYQHKKTLLRAFREFEKIRSAQYDVAVSYRSPFQGQIITTQGHCAFSRLSEDKVFGARIALARAHQDGTVTRHWYDGRYEVMLQADKQGEAYVADMKQPGRTF